MREFWCVLILVVGVAGCGGEDAKNKDKGPSPGSAVNEDAKPFDPAAGTATIAGKVVFEGEAGKRRPIDMGSDPKCASLHEGKILEESVCVGDGGGLANAFVWVKTGLEDWTFEAPKSPAVLDQVGCVYTPHVLAVQEGQEIKVRNSDSVTHNVHAFAEWNEGFNFSQAKKGQENVQVFDRSEVAVKVKCDIHGWMNAWIAVVRHPFFAVTGEDGTFELKGLPPGKYEVEAWHEVYGTQSFEIEVADGATANVEFKFQED